MAEQIENSLRTQICKEKSVFERKLDECNRIGDTGSMLDLLRQYYERIDREVGFPQACRQIEFNYEPYQQNAIQRDLSVEQMKAFMGEEFLAHYAERFFTQEQKVEQKNPIHQASLWLRDRFARLLEDKKLNFLAEKLNTKAEAKPNEESESLAVAADLLSGLRKHFSVDAPARQSLKDKVADLFERFNKQPSLRELSSEDRMCKVIGHVDRITTHWPESIRHRIFVVTQEEANEHLRIAGQQPPGHNVNGIKGFSQDGDIFLVSDNQRNLLDIEKTLWHEWTHVAFHDIADSNHPVQMYNEMYQIIRDDPKLYEWMKSVGGEAFTEKVNQTIMEATDKGVYVENTRAKLGYILAETLIEMPMTEDMDSDLKRRVAFLIDQHGENLNCQQCHAAAAYCQNRANFFAVSSVVDEPRKKSLEL